MVITRMDFIKQITNLCSMDCSKSAWKQFEQSNGIYAKRLLFASMFDDDSEYIFDFHIVYNPSYSAIQIFFLVYNDDIPLSIHELWKLLKMNDDPEKHLKLSQDIHPIIDVVMFSFHPCMFESLTKCLKEQCLLFNYLMIVQTITKLIVILTFHLIN